MLQSNLYVDNSDSRSINMIALAYRSSIYALLDPKYPLFGGGSKEGPGACTYLENLNLPGVSELYP